MAERNLAVRLAVIDGGKVKAELRDVGESGERALKRIEDAGRPASKALQAVDAAAGEVRGSLESAASRLGPVGAALTRLGPAGLVTGAALGAIAFGLKTSLEAAAEAETSYRRLFVNRDQFNRWLKTVRRKFNPSPLLPEEKCEEFLTAYFQSGDKIKTKSEIYQECMRHCPGLTKRQFEMIWNRVAPPDFKTPGPRKKNKSSHQS